MKPAAFRSRSRNTPFAGAAGPARRDDHRRRRAGEAMTPALLAPGGRPRVPRRCVRGRRRGVRRGRLQHDHDRLPGGPHRSVLPRPDRRHDLPAHRQLRRQPRGRGVAAPWVDGFVVQERRDAEQLARAAVARRLPGASTASSASRASTRAPSPAICATAGRMEAIISDRRARRRTGWSRGRAAAARARRPRPGGRGHRGRVLRLERGRRRRLAPAATRRRPRRASTWWRLSTSASSATSSAAAPRSAAASRSCPPRRPPRPSSAMKPDGVFLSNGPGDPEARRPTRSTAVRGLVGKMPIFGICLGHQILASPSAARPTSSSSATAAPTSRCTDLRPARSRSPSQNHGFAVDVASVAKLGLDTHVNLNDQTSEGMRHRELPIFSVSTTPRPAPARTTRTTCSSASST